jgi:hypothetical protein
MSDKINHFHHVSASGVRTGGVIEGGEFIEGVGVVGGITYTTAEWGLKKRYERIEAKLDAIMSHLGIAPKESG